MAVSHIKTSPAAAWTGTVTVFNSQGSTTTIAATNLVRPGDWNSAHNILHTLSGNTLLSSTASGTEVVVAASGPTLSLVGSSDSVIWSTPQYASSMEFPPSGPPATLSNLIASNDGNASRSGAVAFNVKQPISADFLRLLISYNNQSTTIATTASSMSASADGLWTWNAVIYSLGTGASSRSLMSVASASLGITQRASISVDAGGSQYSISQSCTFPVENGITTSSTQYSATQTNYALSSNYLTPFSGNRCLDITFSNTLAAGAYWLVLGISTTRSTNSTAFNFGTAANLRFNNIAGNTQVNVAYGIMGSTNLTSGGVLGAGSFTTAGGGTTAALPISAISSFSSNPQVYFQLLRSA